MVMSNFIDDAERHAELYDEFTPRQRSVLELVAEATLASRNDGNVRAFLAYGPKTAKPCTCVR